MRDGTDWRAPRDFKTGIPTHTARRVYGEMLLQICSAYHVLPDPRTLSLTEIRFFYEGLRKQLRESTKPRASSD